MKNRAIPVPPAGFGRPRNRRAARTAALFLLLLCCLLLKTPAAQAAKTVYPPIWLECGEGDAAQRVILWEYGSNVTFFLPAGFDTEHMRLLYDSPISAVTVDGKDYQSGDPLALSSLAGEHKIKYRRASFSLRVMVSENLPAMFLTTESGSLQKINANKHYKESGAIRLFDENGALLLSDGLEHVKGRGNSSFLQPKRPYQIKFSTRTSLFGMPKAKKWVLLANHKDESLIRNSILFESARRLKEKYPNDDQYIDLYINCQYMGTYELCQKVEIDENRISVFDLQKATEALNDLPLDSYKRFGSSQYKKGTAKGFKIPNDPEDITGGYLLDLEKPFHYPENPNGLVTKRGISFIVKSPEYMSEKQAAYISAAVQRLEDAIYAKDGRDPETGRHFTELADLDSMVREYLLEEVFKNYDVNKSSQFIVKPSDAEDGKFYFGPTWDFDLSMGMWCDGPKNNTIVSPKRLLAASGSGWLPSLCKHQVFMERVYSMYYEELLPYLRALTGLEPDGETVTLSEREDTLKASAAMNFTRWPVLAAPWPVQTGTTFDENYTYLNNWLVKRMDYLDSIWKSKYDALNAKREGT